MTMNLIIRQLHIILALAIYAALGISAARADHPCTTPLVLDLDGDEVAVSNPTNGVDFDITGDGVTERIGWPVWDALLWIDLNENGVVDDGRELFGTSMLLPSGEFAENGFQALAVYDQPEFGGNGDGFISRQDSAWHQVRLWVDGNRDGISQGNEIFRLPQKKIVWISLDYEPIDIIDGGGNRRSARGVFGIRRRALGTWQVHEQTVDDVIFALQLPDF